MSDAPQPASGQAQPHFTLNAQYIKDLSFENPNAPQSLAPSDARPNIGVNVDVQARGTGPDIYEVVLKLNANATRDDQALFVAEVLYAGAFTIRGFPPEHMELAVLVQCPTLLFPFARRVLADVVRDGGFPPLLLDPINFLELYQRQKQQQQAAAGNPPSGTA